MTGYWTAPDGNGDDTIWTGDPDRPLAVVRRCDLGVPAAYDDFMEALALRRAFTESAAEVSRFVKVARSRP